MTTLKVLCVGDPHYKSDNVIETELIASQIYKIILDENPNFVVILGDMLHFNEKIGMFPLMRITEFIRTIKSLVKSTYILIGNHDRPNQKTFLTDKHAFNSFKEWSGVTVVDDVIIKSEQGNDNNNYNFLFVPYLPIGRFNEA